MRERATRTVPAGIPNSSPMATSAGPDLIGGCEPSSVLSTSERADSGRTPSRCAVARHAVSTAPRYATRPAARLGVLL